MDLKICFLVFIMLSLLHTQTLNSLSGRAAATYSFDTVTLKCEMNNKTTVLNDNLS